jgi:hypothetical protein
MKNNEDEENTGDGVLYDSESDDGKETGEEKIIDN